MPGAVILSHKSGHRDPERLGQHPEKLVALGAGSPARHIGGSESIYNHLENYIRYGVGHGLQHGRNPDLQNSSEIFPGNADLCGLQPVALPALHQDSQNQGSGERLAEDRRQGGAHDAHPQNRDKKDIEDDIRQAGYHQEKQRPPRIPDGAENTGAGIVKDIRDHPREINRKISDRFLQSILRGIHDHQQPSCHQHSEDHGGGAQNQSHPHSRMHRIGDMLFLPRPVKLGDDNRRAGAETRKRADQQVDNHCRCSADGGQGCRPDKTPHDDGICRVIEHLEKCSEQKGKEKQQQLFPDHAFRNLIGCFCTLVHAVIPCTNPETVRPLHKPENAAPPMAACPILKETPRAEPGRT